MSRSRQLRTDAGPGVSAGAAIAIGAAVGLVLGILISVATDLPLAPEAGALLGGVVGWLATRSST